MSWNKDVSNNEIHECEFFSGKMLDVTFRSFHGSIHCRRCSKELKDCQVDPEILREINIKRGKREREKEEKHGQDEVYKFVKKNRKFMTSREIADELNVAHGSVSNSLRRLFKHKEIQRKNIKVGQNWMYFWRIM